MERERRPRRVLPKDKEKHRGLHTYCVTKKFQSMPEIEPGTSVSVGKQATPAPPQLLTNSSHLKHFVFKSEDKGEWIELYTINDYR